MSLNIGTSIRRLRQEKNVTQEDLANAIGVTAQAVSRWERAEGYPDITLMPKIARYFGVSLDDVYGLDEKREKQEIRDLINRVRSRFPNEERETLLREGIEKYPGSHELMAELAEVLIECDMTKSADEAIRLFEEVLERCTDEAVRHRANKGICKAFELAGRHKEAVRAAQKLPDMTQTSGNMLSRILTGDELINHVQRSLMSVVIMMDIWIRRMAKEDAFSGEERIRLYEKVLTMYGILTDDGACPFPLMWCEMLWLDIAQEKMALGDKTGCLDALDKAADCLIRYAAIPEDELRTGESLLQNRVKYKVQNCSLSKTGTAERWLSDPDFEPVRDTDEFRAILAKLTE